MGDLVLLDSNSYHFGRNVGANFAEAVNFSSPYWIPRIRYTECNCPNESSGRIPRKGMMIKDGSKRSSRSARLTTSVSKGLPKNGSKVLKDIRTKGGGPVERLDQQC